MKWDPNDNKLTITEDGTYFVMSSLQVGTRENITIDNGGDIYYWIELNGGSVVDSGSWISVSPTSKSNTVISQYTLALKKGDVLRFLYSSTQPDIGLVTFYGTELRPASPGATLSIFKIEP